MSTMMAVVRRGRVWCAVKQCRGWAYVIMGFHPARRKTKATGTGCACFQMLPRHHHCENQATISPQRLAWPWSACATKLRHATLSATVVRLYSLHVQLCGCGIALVCRWSGTIPGFRRAGHTIIACPVIWPSARHGLTMFSASRSRLQSKDSMNPTERWPRTWHSRWSNPDECRATF